MPFNEAMSWSDFFSRNVADNSGTHTVSQAIDTGPIPVTASIKQTRMPVSTDTSGGDYVTESGDVIRTTSTARDARNVQELQARIKAANGVLIVGGESSDYIVAANNGLKFSVTRNAAGKFEIRDSQNYIYLIAAAILIGVVVLSRK